MRPTVTAVREFADRTFQDRIRFVHSQENLGFAAANIRAIAISDELAMVDTSCACATVVA